MASHDRAVKIPKQTRIYSFIYLSISIRRWTASSAWYDCGVI